MITIQAKCSCPKHGRLSFDEIIIRNGSPLCGKCNTVLEYCVVKPRFDVNGGGKTQEKNPTAKKR